jgi:hypothetical protein
VPRRFVPARLHGLLDYMTIGLFVAGGDLFKIEDAPGSTVPAQLFGLALCFTCPLTNYGRDRPFGGVPAISMKTHLTLDAIGGTAVGLSPWLTGSWRKGWQYWAPQTFALTSELFFALTTKTDT